MISTPVGMYARIRKLVEAAVGSPEIDDVTPTLSQQLELLIAQGAAPYQEIVRAGLGVKVGTTTAVAGIVAIPTTAVAMGLYNADPDGGRSMVIDWVAAINAVSTAVATQAQMLALVGQVRETAPADGGLTFTKLNGNGSTNKPNVNVLSILTATALPATTGLATNWFPVGQQMLKTGVAATPGYGGQTPIDGRIVVAPGRYFALHVLSSVVGETFNVFAGFHMKQLNLG